MSRRFLFLEREGTLATTDPHGVPTAQWATGIAEFLRQGQELGYGVIVTAHEPLIGRGHRSLADAAALHEEIASQSRAQGVEIAGFYLCPHSEGESCDCRKPGLGLTLAASRDLGVDLLGSVVLAREARDIAWSQSMGTRVVAWAPGGEASLAGADAKVSEPSEAIEWLRRWMEEPSGRALAARHLEESARTQLAVRDACLPDLLRAVEFTAEALKQGKKLLICGNGGSAADSQHLAAEFVGRLSAQFTRRAWPAIALTTDSSSLTAIGNDYGFDRIFARQVEALGQPGDVLVALSTSGNSPNVLEAVESARLSDLRVVVLTGGSGGALAHLADVAIVVPSGNGQHIQEAHLTLYHLLCALVERRLYPLGETV